jgi:hypothetical protein
MLVAYLLVILGLKLGSTRVRVKVDVYAFSFIIIVFCSLLNLIFLELVV